eukprot:8745102-Pyramimonas_sp.AAC.1
MCNPDFNFGILSQRERLLTPIKQCSLDFWESYDVKCLYSTDLLLVRSTNHTVKVYLEAKTQTDQASALKWWPAADVLQDAEQRFASVAATHDRTVAAMPDPVAIPSAKPPKELLSIFSSDDEDDNATPHQTHPKTEQPQVSQTACTFWHYNPSTIPIQSNPIQSNFQTPHTYTHFYTFGCIPSFNPG